jgi:hypothetical protein
MLHTEARQAKARAYQALEEVGAVGIAVLGGSATYVWQAVSSTAMDTGAALADSAKWLLEGIAYVDAHFSSGEVHDVQLTNATVAGSALVTLAAVAYHRR